MVIQLDQEIERAKIGDGFCPCVTPGGLFYYSLMRKLLTGIDFACLQGVSKADLDKYNLSDLPDKALRDFFGNAFSSTVSTFALLSAIYCLGRD